MKFIALLKVDKPMLWARWHPGCSALWYRSEALSKKTDAKAWLEEELKKYPNARVNSDINDREYYIYTTIITVNDNEQELANVDEFLRQIGCK